MPPLLLFAWPPIKRLPTSGCWRRSRREPLFEQNARPKANGNNAMTMTAAGQRWQDVEQSCDSNFKAVAFHPAVGHAIKPRHELHRRNGACTPSYMSIVILLSVSINRTANLKNNNSNNNYF